MRTWRWALIALSCLATAPVQAQTYPSRTITLVVTAAAGGVSDLIARAVGHRLTQAWGQQVVIENRGGAAHVLGAQTVARAAPDGHTLLVAEAGTFVINPTLYPAGKLPYDTVNDFAPITGLICINQAFIARNSLPAADVAGLIKLAKQRPGELTYGTAGVGSAPQMNCQIRKHGGRQPAADTLSRCSAGPERHHSWPYRRHVGQRELGRATASGAKAEGPCRGIAAARAAIA